MSFMAGFAEGFVPSFQAGIARKEKRKDDQFKLMYSEFIDRRDKKKKWETQDRKNVQKAKALTEGTGLPEGAWMKAYEWIQAGLSDEVVQERLQKGTFTPSEMPAGEVSKSRPVDQTVQMMGQEAPQAPSPTTPTQPTQSTGEKVSAKTSRRGPKGLFENLGNLGGILDVTTQEDINQDALERIAAGTGLSVEEVQQVYKTMPEPMDTSGAPSFIPEQPDIPSLEQALFNLENARTPQELEQAQEQIDASEAAFIFKEEFKADAKARAEGLGINQKQVKYLDPETGKVRMTQVVPGENPGKWVHWRTGEPIPNPAPITEAEEEELSKLYDMAEGKEAQDYRSKSNALLNTYRIGGQMGELVQQTPELTAPWASGLVQAGHRIIAEAKTAQKLLGGSDPQEILSKALSDSDGDGNGGIITHEEAARLREYKQALQEGDLDEEIRSIMGDNAYQVAVNKTLFDTNAALMAYELAVTAGQEGRALSDRDREIFAQAALGGTGGSEKFLQNMGMLLNNRRKDLESRGRSLNELNERVRNFTERFDWPNPPDVLIATPIDEKFEDEMRRNPNFANYVSMFDKYKPNGDTGTFEVEPKRPVSQQQSNIPQGSMPIGRTKDGRMVYETPDGKQIVE